MPVSRVARVRNRNALSRWSASVRAREPALAGVHVYSLESTGMDSRCRYLARTAADDFAPQPGSPGYPSAASPTSARRRNRGSIPAPRRTFERGCRPHRTSRARPAVQLTQFECRVRTVPDPLSGVQIVTRSTRGSRAAHGGRRRQRVVRLELHHGPDNDARGREDLFEQVELGQEIRLNPFARFVAGPEAVAEGFE